MSARVETQVSGGARDVPQSDVLRNAEGLARRSGLLSQLIIDADVHHIDVLSAVRPYLGERLSRLVTAAPREQLLPANIGDRSMGGRLKRPSIPPYDENLPPTPIRNLVTTMARLGVDYSIMFPGDLLQVGLHPSVDFEVALARAYAQWLTERVLPYEPRVKGLLYLPMSDPAASARIVDDFGHHAGVVGCMVTTTRQQQINRNPYMELYEALEEHRLTLAFHGIGPAWPMQVYRVLDTFLAAGALCFPFDTAVLLTQLVMGGVVERFPNLTMAFLECGLAWVPMVSGRLDTAYHMRIHEAPLLRRLPSEYMEAFYFGMQPIEHPTNLLQARELIHQVGTHRILFASDYPHRDFDLPTSITDLGFLTDADKTAILCTNAVKAFHLEGEELTLASEVGPR